MNNETNTQNELKRHAAQMQALDRLTSAERKESAADWLEDMQENAAMIADRIGWILNGSYGQGACMLAWRVIDGSKRINKQAQLAQMIAALEWSCIGRDAVKAWKTLNADQKAHLAEHIQAEIDTAENLPDDERPVRKGL